MKRILKRVTGGNFGFFVMIEKEKAGEETCKVIGVVFYRVDEFFRV